MRVAVIGGTGVIGHHVLAELEARGHQTVAVARRPGAVRRGEVRSANALHVGSLDEAIAGVDAVVYAAGSLHQSMTQTFHDIHVKGLRNLVQACRAARVRRVIHLSSLGARSSSRSAYHRAKHEGEQIIRRSLLDVTVLRPSAVFARGDDFLTPLAGLLRRLPVAPYPGRGEARLAPVAAVDVARAVAALLETPGTIGEVYDFAGPEILTIGEIYDRVMRALSLRRPKIGVPYLIIEPMTHLFRAAPGVPFSFDHLAILEEELAPGAAPAPTPPSIAPRTRFSADVIRDLLAG